MLYFYVFGTHALKDTYFPNFMKGRYLMIQESKAVITGKSVVAILDGINFAILKCTLLLLLKYHFRELYNFGSIGFVSFTAGL